MPRESPVAAEEMRLIEGYFPHCLRVVLGAPDPAGRLPFEARPMQGCLEQRSHRGTEILTFWLSLPLEVVIRSLSIGLQKRPGAAALPALMPTIALGYVDERSGAYVPVVGPFTDPSATLAAYQNYHVVTTPDVAHTIEQGRRYAVFVQGDDTSGDEGDGLLIHRPALTVLAPPSLHI